MNGDEIMILGICSVSALACIVGLMKTFFPARGEDWDWTKEVR